MEKKRVRNRRMGRRTGRKVKRRRRARLLKKICKHRVSYRKNYLRHLTEQVQITCEVSNIFVFTQHDVSLPETELASKHTAGWDLALNSRFGWPWTSVFQQPHRCNVLTGPTPSPKASPHRGYKSRHLYFSPAALTPEASIHHLWELTDIWKVTVTNLRYRHPRHIASLLCLKPPTESRPSLLRSNWKGHPGLATNPANSPASVSLPQPYQRRHCGLLRFIFFIHTCMSMASGPWCLLPLLPETNANSDSVPSYSTPDCIFARTFLPGSTLRNIISGRTGSFLSPPFYLCYCWSRE